MDASLVKSFEDIRESLIFPRTYEENRPCMDKSYANLSFNNPWSFVCFIMIFYVVEFIMLLKLLFCMLKLKFLCSESWQTWTSNTVWHYFRLYNLHYYGNEFRLYNPNQPKIWTVALQAMFLVFLLRLINFKCFKRFLLL